MVLHASGEDYLEAVLVLKKEKGMIRSTDLALHMGFTRPSICHAVAVLREGGFLTMDTEGFLHLTDIGQEVAENIYERHNFFRDRLIEAGVDKVTAGQEACQMEHTVSQQTFEKIKKMYREQSK